MSPLRYDDDSRGIGFNAGGSVRLFDPDTSQAAAKSMTAPILSDQRMRVLQMAGARELGVTAWTIAWQTETDEHRIQQNVAARRLKDLAEMGLVERTDETRRGSSQRECAVYRVTDAGREALR